MSKTVFAVARRTHEVGIRMALGASHRRVRALIVRQTAPVLLVGTLIGVGVAAAIARVAASQIPGQGISMSSSAALHASRSRPAAYLCSRLPIKVW